MDKYIEINNDKVISVLISGTTPTNTDEITYISADGVNPLPSRDWRYDSSTSTFFPPVFYKLNHSTFHVEGVYDIVLEQPSGSFFGYNTTVTCSFNREINELTISDVEIDENVEISNFNHDTINHLVTFDLVSSSNATIHREDNSTIKPSTNGKIKFKNQVAVDTKGWKWDLKDINVLIY